LVITKIAQAACYITCYSYARLFK